MNRVDDVDIIMMTGSGRAVRGELTGKQQKQLLKVCMWVRSGMLCDFDTAAALARIVSTEIMEDDIPFKLQEPFSAEGILSILDILEDLDEYTGEGGVPCHSFEDIRREFREYETPAQACSDLSLDKGVDQEMESIGREYSTFVRLESGGVVVKIE